MKGRVNIGPSKRFRGRRRVFNTSDPGFKTFNREYAFVITDAHVGSYRELTPETTTPATINPIPFVVPDANWRAVLRLVPLSTSLVNSSAAGSAAQVLVLIYHKEGYRGDD